MKAKLKVILSNIQTEPQKAINELIKIIDSLPSESRCPPVCKYYDLKTERNLVINFFERASDEDIQECINGFADRVYDRLFTPLIKEQGETK